MMEWGTKYYGYILLWVKTYCLLNVIDSYVTNDFLFKVVHKQHPSKEEGGGYPKE